MPIVVELLITSSNLAIFNCNKYTIPNVVQLNAICVRQLELDFLLQELMHLGYLWQDTSVY